MKLNARISSQCAARAARSGGRRVGGEWAAGAGAQLPFGARAAERRAERSAGGAGSIGGAQRPCPRRRPRPRRQQRYVTMPPPPARAAAKRLAHSKIRSTPEVRAAAVRLGANVSLRQRRSCLLRHATFLTTLQVPNGKINIAFTIGIVFINSVLQVYYKPNYFIILFTYFKHSLQQLTCCHSNTTSALEIVDKSPTREARLFLIHWWFQSKLLEPTSWLKVGSTHSLFGEQRATNRRIPNSVDRSLAICRTMNIRRSPYPPRVGLLDTSKGANIRRTHLLVGIGQAIVRCSANAECVEPP